MGLTLPQLMMAIIAISLLVLVGFQFFSDSGSFTEIRGVAKDTVNNWKVNTTQVGSVGEVTIPQSHRSAIISLNNSIHKMINANGQCVTNFGGFPDLEDEGTTITLTNHPSGHIEVLVMAGEGGKQIVTDLRFNIPNAQLCVIGGEETITEGFESLVDGESPGKYWGTTNSIKIQEDDGGPTGWTENRINYGQGFMDFEAQSWLFTPDNKYICFLPTVDGGSDEDGVNDDIVQELPGAISLC